MQMSMFYLYFFHIGLPKKNNNKIKINKKRQEDNKNL